MTETMYMALDFINQNGLYKYVFAVWLTIHLGCEMNITIFQALTAYHVAFSWIMSANREDIIVSNKDNFRLIIFIKMLAIIIF